MIANPPTAKQCPDCRIPPPDVHHPQFIPGHGWTDAHLQDRALNPTTVPGLENYPPDMAAAHIRLATRHLRKLNQHELGLRCYSPNPTTNWLARQGMLKRGWPIPAPQAAPYQHRRKIVAQTPIPEPPRPASAPLWEGDR